jgi:alginate O-acetyltransferase complex protein AlgI
MQGLADLIHPDLLPEWMYPAFLHDLWIEWRVRYPGPPVEFLIFCLLALLLPGKRYRTFFLLVSLVALYAYFGAIFAGGLLLGSAVVWALGELLARWSARRGAAGAPTFVGAVVIHAATFWLFWQTLPGLHYLTRDEHMTKGELWLFCGVAFTVLRAVYYLRHACRDPQRPRRPADCVLYLLFFPLYRIGPVLAPNDFLQRLDAAPANRSRRMVWIGAVLFAIGCVKLAVGGCVIEPYFRHFFPPGSRPMFPEFLAPTTHAPAWQYWLGAPLFYLRVYCIFSGYTDAARGMCSLVGMETPHNFLTPFSCATLSAFWQRWHVTFAGWVRTMIYLPLGGNRRTPRLNTLLTFLYAGAWHFPYLNAPIFAAINAGGLLIERTLSPWWQRTRERSGPLYSLSRRLRLADGPLGVAVRWLWTHTIIALAGVACFDWNHGGIYFLAGLFGG